MKKSHVILLISTMMLPSLGFASTDRIISVSGECLKSVGHDRGTVTLTANFLAPQAATASAKAVQQYEYLRAQVNKLELKDLQLQTESYTVDEEVDWRDNKRVLRGYRARMGLQVMTSDISRLGEVIALSSKSGMGEAAGLRTYVSVQKNRAERESCLSDALKNAQSKAEKMAQAVGAKVGKVMTIQEAGPSDSGPQPPMRNFMAKGHAELADAAGAPVVESQNQVIHVAVAVSFRLE